MVDVDMAEVRKRIARQQYSDEYATLRAFIERVEAGIPPTDEMLRYMAEGAREFLLGGKPWQKEGGRPSKPHGPRELAAYLLQRYGELRPQKVALVLGETDPDGGDRVQTMRRTIRRGELAFCMAKLNDPGLIKSSFYELLELGLEDLTNDQRRKCIQGLRAGLAELELDDGEPI